MKIPQKIDPCPIRDAILEIRFTSNIDPNAIYGIIYNKIKNNYPKTTQLGLLQIPEVFRKKDAELKYKPLYKLTNGNYAVQIGTNVITISNYNEYQGWDNFSKKIYSICEMLKELDIIESISRVGLRYINYFTENIYDLIKLKIDWNTRNTSKDIMYFRSNFIEDDIINTLQIANKAEISFDKEKMSGSILDIDSYTDKNLDAFLKDYQSIIEKVHNVEKKIFFNLLEDEFLSSLKPIYEDKQ